MKKILLSSAACLLSLSAQAFEYTPSVIHPYVGARVNYNMFDYDYKEGSFHKSLSDNIFGGSVMLGAKIYHFRTELEGFYNQEGKDNFEISGYKFPAEIDSKGLFLNVYYDVPTGTAFTPYFGGGIGYTWIKGSMEAKGLNLSTSKKASDFSWNLGLGVSYDINQHSHVELGYKYIDHGDFDMGGNVEAEVNSHTITLGIRYEL